MQRSDAAVKISKLLSGRDENLILQLISECQHHHGNAIAQDTQGIDATRNIRALLSDLVPHDMFAYGFFETRTLRVTNCFNVDFPQSYIDTSVVVDGQLKSPVIRTWMGTLKPTYVNSRILDSQYASATRWIQNFRQHEMESVVVHGVIDANNLSASCFALGGLYDPWDQRSEYILSVTVPHLHAVFGTAAARTKGTHPTFRPLSPRELEVIRWLALGKSVSDIGAILGISDFTVRTHIQRLINKLEATNRSHAVARAIQAGVITGI